MFHRSIKFSIALAVFFLLTTAMGTAFAQEWVVARATGQVWIGGEGVQRVSLSDGTSVPAGASVTTSSRGRALLVRGEQRVLVAPNSIIALPAASASQASVVQTVGEVLFDIDPRNTHHFSVSTPYLAALVKGTQFIITVSSSGARVTVTQGVVLVTDQQTGEQIEVPAGQSVSTGSDDTDGLSILGSQVDPAGSPGSSTPSQTVESLQSLHNTVMSTVRRLAPDLQIGATVNQVGQTVSSLVGGVADQTGLGHQVGRLARGGGFGGGLANTSASVSGNSTENAASQTAESSTGGVRESRVVNRVSRRLDDVGSTIGINADLGGIVSSTLSSVGGGDGGGSSSSSSSSSGGSGSGSGGGGGASSSSSGGSGGGSSSSGGGGGGSSSSSGGGGGSSHGGGHSSHGGGLGGAVKDAVGGLF